MRTPLFALVAGLMGCPPSSCDAFPELLLTDSGIMELSVMALDDADTGWDEQAPGVVSGRADVPCGSYVFIPMDWDADGQEDGRFEAWTDADGHYRFEGVPEGEHPVWVAVDPGPGDGEGARCMALASNN